VGVVLIAGFTSCSTWRAAKATSDVAGMYRDLTYETKISDFDGYEDWMKVNEETITGDVFGVLGPAHERAEGFREVYINKTGKKVSTGRDDFPYPVGTIIVKESYANDGGRKGDLANLTVMMKRGSGYDLEHGDWEYMMVSPSNEVLGQGCMDMCIGCHAAAADSDWVYNDRR
jgi:hypothetical protein